MTVGITLDIDEGFGCPSFSPVQFHTPQFQPTLFSQIASQPSDKD